LIPLKTYIYAALYWEWQWRAWEKTPAPRPDLDLTPLIPIVLFTGPRPWGSARHFRELFRAPPELTSYVPDWQPVFWELADYSTEQLLHQPSVFLKSLAILKAEPSDFTTATALFREVFDQIDSLHATHHSRWAEALAFLFGWSHNKRPANERPLWHDFALQLRQESERYREIAQMSQTIAQSYIEEGKQLGREEGKQLGREEGKQLGREEGKQLGRLEEAKALLVLLAEDRLGTPDAPIRVALDALTDLARIQRMVRQASRSASWSELLTIE
jgi:hypothetical protein